MRKKVAVVGDRDSVLVFKALGVDVFESIDKECPDMEKDFRNKLRKPISINAKNMIMNYIPPDITNEERIKK